ncbi:MAG: glycogen debranching enzyme family protein, partial [Oscillospiraceae bacterium]|nr:glycogen debranching enzyme family protein [Oscillospiraceae bacterium]
MRFLYGKQDMRTLQRAQENCFLVTNGLGGYASVTSAFSVSRSDHGILVAAVKAPNERLVMVHRLREVLELDGRSEFLSTQTFADGTPPEEGYRHLACFEFERLPRWSYEVAGVRVTRRLCMDWERNTTAVQYTVENRSGRPCTLRITPIAKFAPKEEALEAAPAFTYKNGRITGQGRVLYLRSDAHVRAVPACAERLAYPEDEKDGRPARGWAAGCCEVFLTVKPGRTDCCELVFSTEKEAPAAGALWDAAQRRLAALEQAAGFRDETARQLVLAADAFIARRDSTGGKTILAGYPLFSDWGRDTMIALPGCTLATGRFEDAKSILRTFLAYEQDGLVPNLFPEGTARPMYNTVDAALLLIDCVWQYVKRTGDLDFAREA